MDMGNGADDAFGERAAEQELERQKGTENIDWGVGGWGRGGGVPRKVPQGDRGGTMPLGGLYGRPGNGCEA